MSSTTSLGLGLSLSNPDYPKPDRFTPVLMNTNVADVVAKYLNAEEICAFTRINRASFDNCQITKPYLKELHYRDRLLNHLLPGIKETQLPSNLTSYNPKAKEVAWEETYNALSKVVYGPAFLKSIGIRAVGPTGPVPECLLERKYLPTHSVEIAANSMLGLTKEGNLTYGPQEPDNPDDPGHYAPQGHRHYLPGPVEGAVGIRRLEFPNTQYNREFLNAAPYPMQSPLEQGSPLIAFQTDLELDVPAESRLRATPEGVLTEEPGPTEQALNGKRTVRFLNTPHNWQTLAWPVPRDPTRKAGPNNPYVAKYLSANAKPVTITFVEEIRDIPVIPGWIFPAAKLVAFGGSYLEQIAEAEAIGQHSMTFEQDIIHRILTLIKGNTDPHLYRHARTSTDVTFFGGTHQTGSIVHSYTDSPMVIARLFLNDNLAAGFAAAWS